MVFCIFYTDSRLRHHHWDLQCNSLCHQKRQMILETLSTPNLANLHSNRLYQPRQHPPRGPDSVHVPPNLTSSTNAIYGAHSMFAGIGGQTQDSGYSELPQQPSPPTDRTRRQRPDDIHSESEYDLPPSENGRGNNSLTWYCLLYHYAVLLLH